MSSFYQGWWQCRVVQVTSTLGVPMSLESLVDSSTFLSVVFILFSSKWESVLVTFTLGVSMSWSYFRTPLLPPKSSSYCSQVSEGRCRSLLSWGCLCHRSHFSTSSSVVFIFFSSKWGAVQVISTLRVPMSLESLMDSYLLLSHLHIFSK